MREREVEIGMKSEQLEPEFVNALIRKTMQRADEKEQRDEQELLAFAEGLGLGEAASERWLSG